MSLTSKELADFKKGEWEIPCFAMELTKGGGQVLFTGTGIIRQNAERKISFVLLVSPVSGNLSKVLLAENNTTIGKLIPKEDSVFLTATDARNRGWRSTSSVDYTPTVHQNEAITINGIARELTATVALDSSLAFFNEQRRKKGVTGNDLFYTKPSITYHVFSGLEFPVNKRVEMNETIEGNVTRKSSAFAAAQFSSSGFDVLVNKDGNGVCVLATSQDKQVAFTNPHTCERILEAFQFVLSSPVQWDVCIIRQGNNETISLRTWPSAPPSCRLRPPFQWRMTPDDHVVWKLFDCYLRYILINDTHYYHSLSCRIQSILHASAGTWETELLTLGVEVEGLLSDHFDRNHLPVADSKSLDDALSILDTAITNKDLIMSRRIHDKVRSSFAYLKKSTKQRLVALVQDGVVRQADVEAWEHVRNKSAHADYASLEPTQENFDRRRGVIVLMYCLVFHVIKYSGRFTDYAMLPGQKEGGFPESTYPFLVNDVR